MRLPRSLRPPPAAPLLAALALAALVLAAPRPAAACDPELIEQLLSEADGHLAYAVRAGDLVAARLALRRVAFTLNDAEAQMISCGCLNAQQEVASAAAEARRAAAATDYDALVVAFEGALSAFQLTLLAMDEENCR